MPPRKKKISEETTNELSTQQQNIVEPASEDKQTQLSDSFEKLVEPNSEPQPENTQTEYANCASQQHFAIASLQTAQSAISQLLQKQGELRGIDAADQAWDSFEQGFVNRTEQRFQGFVDSLVPELRQSFTALQDRAIARQDKRQTVFSRLKQIASLVTDECKLLLPSNEPVGNLLGFASWDVPNNQEDSTDE